MVLRGATVWMNDEGKEIGAHGSRIPEFTLRSLIQVGQVLDRVDDLRVPRLREVVASQDLDRSQLNHRLHGCESLGDDSDHTAMRYQQRGAISMGWCTLDNFKHPLNPALDPAGEIRAALTAGICEPRVEPTGIPPGEVHGKSRFNLPCGQPLEAPKVDFNKFFNFNN